MSETFLEQLTNAARSRPWIQNVEIHTAGKVVRARLGMFREAFVDVYYNRQTGSVSYAYIEGGQRKLGVNNMRIGWHIHPFGREKEHQPSQSLTVEQFLERLEEELNQRDQL